MDSVRIGKELKKRRKKNGLKVDFTVLHPCYFDDACPLLFVECTQLSSRCHDCHNSEICINVTVKKNKGAKRILLVVKCFEVKSAKKI